MKKENNDLMKIFRDKTDLEVIDCYVDDIICATNCYSPAIERVLIEILKEFLVVIKLR